MNSGLNNQKFALLGLVREALEKHRNIALPSIVDFRAGGLAVRDFPFEEIFDKERFTSFCTNMHILTDDFMHPIEILDTHYLFGQGTQFVKALPSGDNRTSTIVKTFLSFLGPSKPILTACASIDVDKFDVVVQLRVENDWVEYTNRPDRAKLFGSDEDKTTNPLDILRKIRQSHHFVNCRDIFVCIDETNIPFTLPDLRLQARNMFGFNLHFKSDFRHDFREWDGGTRDSLIDFNLSATAKLFVGTSRSTFSNLSCMTAAAANRAGREDYVYNADHRALKRRVDIGVFPHPGDATSKVVKFQV